MVDPDYKMLWAEQVPHLTFTDEHGRAAEVTIIAGPPAETEVAGPPPASWAARPGTDVAIWHLRLDPHARYVLPATSKTDVTRMLHVFEGDTFQIADVEVDNGVAVSLRPEEPVELIAGSKPVSALMLQGAPIGEPVVAQGVFVMNTSEELQQAYDDYYRTRFGGWPWPDPLSQSRYELRTIRPSPRWSHREADGKQTTR